MSVNILPTNTENILEALKEEEEDEVYVGGTMRQHHTLPLESDKSAIQLMNAS